MLLMLHNTIHNWILKFVYTLIIRENDWPNLKSAVDVLAKYHISRGRAGLNMWMTINYWKTITSSFFFCCPCQVLCMIIMDGPPSLHSRSVITFRVDNILMTIMLSPLSRHLWPLETTVIYRTRNLATIYVLYCDADFMETPHNSTQQTIP